MSVSASVSSFRCWEKCPRFAEAFGFNTPQWDHEVSACVSVGASVFFDDCRTVCDVSEDLFQPSSEVSNNPYLLVYTFRN